MLYVRKCICMLLASAMLLGVMVISTGAAYKDQDQIKHKEAVEKLISLNVIRGKADGNFYPEAYVTRAELCKMICIALNGGYDPDLKPKSIPTYWDTKDHWAEEYIEYCTALVTGTGNGQFQPDVPVTGVQAAKMMLGAMGYNTTKYAGASWAKLVNIDAMQVDLYNQLEQFDPSNPLSRDDAAQLIYNGLMSSMVEYQLIPTGESMFDKYFKGKAPSPIE